MAELSLVMTNLPSTQDAERVAEALLDSRLAAAVNVLPIELSLYRWEGEIRRQSEVLLIAKTVQSNYEEVEAAILKLHPYETPSILAIEASSCSEAYLQWVNTALGHTSARGDG